MSYRTGIGYDVHQLVEGRDLYLGGVQIPHTKGLDGHSDADALLHAMADAILGAIGEGDIGQHFPNTDPQWKDVRSTVFLEEIAKKLAARGARLENIDAMLIAEEPKVGPHLAKMKDAISQALGITPEQVGIKATTNETMGFVGRREGIAAMAVACVELEK